MLRTELLKERLREIREEKNISAKELGEALGVAGSTITRYETGVHEPKSAMVKKLADYFDVSPAWLMGADIDRHGDILSYDDPQIFTHLTDDLKDFINNADSVPYIEFAKQLKDHKLTERELNLLTEWLKIAVLKSNNGKQC